MKRHFLTVCAAVFALMVLFPAITARAADNVYAILYADGTLTFQHGNTPESGKTVTKTYAVDLNEVYDYSNLPWLHEQYSVNVVNFADKIRPKDTAYWFCSCSNLKRVDNIQNLDTSNVTSMSWMFSFCSGLTALDVSHFDTANVMSMFCMFNGCSGLTALDVSKFDTANVTDMNFMFSGCSGLTALDVSKFDTANVIRMWAMFSGCSGLTALDVSHFDTANVTNMESMFNGCSGLTALDVSKFDTKNVTSMSYMFRGCSGLTALDVSKFDTAKVTNMQQMFDGCSNLKTIYASDKFTTASVTSDYAMFSGCTSLVGGNGTKYDKSYVDKAYARIDTASAPGYFTAPGTQPTPEPQPETYIITSYAGEGGTVTPDGDTRVRAGDSQKYVMTPNPGYRVQSVRMDGMEIGALSEYTFKNVIRDHSIIVSFERLPRYAITSTVAADGELSVTLDNDSAVTVAVSYFDKRGQFLSADLQSVSANIGKVTFALPFAYKACVALFDSDCRPLCDPVTVR